jgi:epoxyqueuosine reductase
LDEAAILANVRHLAAEQGFSQLRVTPAVDATGFSKLTEWIEAGYAGQMDYFQNRIDAYRHPRGVMEGVRSLVMLAWPYPANQPTETGVGRGRVARYTWTGDDYHDTIHRQLKELARSIRGWRPDCTVRGIVDTAPLLEREFAVAAGIGWQAKNTLVINKYSGSYFFLACLLTDLVLPVDAPHATDHCGTCTRCLDACPTDAFPAPGILDARRCISYLTIEHRGPIDRHLRESMGDWAFGCDICQEVCPWNRPQRLARNRTAPEVASDGLTSLKSDGSGEHGESIELGRLFGMPDEEFRRRYRKTPFWRAGRRGMLRNAAIVLGNQRDPAGLDPLAIGLNDPDAMVRGVCGWAIGRIGGSRAVAMLHQRFAIENEPQVIEELVAAIDQAS